MSRIYWLVVLGLLGAAVIYGSRDSQVAPLYSNTPSGTTGHTLKPGSTNGCSCHSTNAVTSINATLSGPASLYPGDYGNYSITASKTGVTAATTFGFDAAASDASTVISLFNGEPTQTYDVGGNSANREVTHMPTLRQINTATNYYKFVYTMPANATANSTHTLYGLVGGMNIGGWNNASNFTITTKAYPTGPSSVVPGTPASSTVPLSWTGGGPQYRVLYKTGTFPTAVGDGTIAYEGSNTSTTASGLTASTQYYFAVYSKDVGTDSGTSFFSTTSAQTTATTTAALEPNPYVDAVNGSDTNTGTQSSPFKTIKKALTAVGSGGTIHVKPGTYNTSLGETFPITMPSGKKLQSTSGASSTIIDATGANARVFVCTGNSSTTLIEGFTITGGFYQPPADGSNSTGGGIYTSSSDQTTFSRCIIVGNEARGYNATGGGFVSGGVAYGGGIGISSSTTKVVNCVISANIVRGGNGFTYQGVAGNGGDGGNAQGGGVWAFGAAAFTNNTFNSNQSIGGNGGTATVSGSGGSGGTALYGALDAQNATANSNIVSNNSVTGGAAGSGTPNGSAGGAVTGGINAASASNNLFFNNTGGDGSTGTNAITASNPLYVNAPSDLHLRSSSPARRAGLTTGAPTVDLDNNTRTSPPTVGAYEITLFLTATAGIGRITVSWQAVSGASSYNLYMSTSAGVTTSTYQKKITGATSPYVLTPLANNVTEYFVITAIENSVEGPISPEASATSSNGTWVKAAGLTGSGFTNLTRDLATGTTLYATASDSVGLYRSTDGGNTWAGVTGPFNGIAMHAVAANGSNVIVAGTGSIYQSTNSGSTWQTSVSGAGIGEDFVASAAIDPLATTNVYAGDFHLNGGSTSTDLIAKSVDSGATFTNIIDSSSGNLRAYYLAIDPVTSGTLYAAGSGSPYIGKSTNNGGTWTGITPPNTGYPKSLTLAPSSTLVLFAGMSDVANNVSTGVWKSANAGSSWTQMNTGLTGPPYVNALLVDSSDANKVHAGTSAGYYNSTNGGTNWSVGPTTGAYSSATLTGFNAFAQTSTRRLIGTASNGIYLLPLDAAPTITPPLSPNSGPSSGTTGVTITGTGFKSGASVTFDGVAATNVVVSNSTTITATTPAHSAATVDVAVSNSDGQAAVVTGGYTYSSVVCSYTLGASSASFTSSGGSSSVSVTAATGCGWSAVSNDGFINITSGTPGSGNGTVNYTVATNSGAGRTGTMTIAGQTFSVAQSGTSIAAPANPVATASSAAAVALSWSASGGAASYEVARSSSGLNFSIIASLATNSFSDTTVSANTAYLYEVRAVDPSSNRSAYSAADLATTIIFTDDPIVAGTTVVKATHVTQLRTAVNAVRALAGLTAASFTDAPISSTTIVRAVHVSELRNALDPARSNLGLTALSYTDPTLTTGSTLVKAAHWQEIRSGVK